MRCVCRLGKYQRICLACEVMRILVNNRYKIGSGTHFVKNTFADEIKGRGQLSIANFLDYIVFSIEIGEML